MLQCDGYEMCRGKLIVKPEEGGEPYVDWGVCLYRPDTDCWYVQGAQGWSIGYPAGECYVIEEVDVT